jgi:hypothetical protein
MRITLIGGIERNESQLINIAAEAGHSLEFHPGHIGGRGSDEIRRAIERADFVIILTDVNSHGAVLLAKKVCRQVGRGALVLRRCGPSRFRQLLDAVAQRDDHLRVAS